MTAWQTAMLHGASNGTLLALIALGFALIYNSSGLFDVSIAVYYVVAAYVAWSSCRYGGMPVLVAMVFGVLAGALSAWLVDRVVFRPLRERDAKPALQLISSTGVYIAAVNALDLVFGSQTRLLDAPLPRILGWSAAFGQARALQLVVGTAAILASVLVLRRSGFGALVRALRQSPELSEVMGIDTERLRRTIVLFAGILISVAGTLTMVDVGITPYDGMPVLLGAAVAAIVGGLRSELGVVFGAFLLAFSRSVMSVFMSDKWSDAVVFGLLYAVLIMRPEGLLGWRQRVEER